MKKDLVTKLVPLFQGLPPSEVDEAVVEAKRQVDTEVLEKHRSELKKLFDSQMETLKLRDCPLAILEAFQNKRDEVLKKTIEMEIPKGNIPFIPVIPSSYVGIYTLMHMVRNKDKVGYTYLDPNEIINNEETPKNPYFIYDVEPGKVTLGKSAEKAEKMIKKQKRLCHITDEDIAVCVHTNVLSDHYLWSTGSRYEQGDRVPNVCLRVGEPELSLDGIGYSFDEWGSASCCSRG